MNEVYSQKSDILAFVEYTKMCRPKSIKGKRFFLIKQYYYLVKLKAYKASNRFKLIKSFELFLTRNEMITTKKMMI